MHVHVAVVAYRGDESIETLSTKDSTLKSLQRLKHNHGFALLGEGGHTSCGANLSMIKKHGGHGRLVQGKAGYLTFQCVYM